MIIVLLVLILVAIISLGISFSLYGEKEKERKINILNESYFSNRLQESNQQLVLFMKANNLLSEEAVVLKRTIHELLDELEALEKKYKALDEETLEYRAKKLQDVMKNAYDWARSQLNDIEFRRSFDKDEGIADDFPWLDSKELVEYKEEKEKVKKKNPKEKKPKKSK
jgi:hypothetical protein